MTCSGTQHRHDAPSAPGAARYGAALADPRLLSLRDEIALVTARVQELIEQPEAGMLEEGRALWAQILVFIEHRRRLVAAELKRQLVLQQHLSAAEALELMAQVGEAVQRHVSDPATLTAISREFELLRTGRTLAQAAPRSTANADIE